MPILLFRTTKPVLPGDELTFPYRQQTPLARAHQTWVQVHDLPLPQPLAQDLPSASEYRANVVVDTELFHKAEEFPDLRQLALKSLTPVAPKVWSDGSVILVRLFGMSHSEWCRFEACGDAKSARAPLLCAIVHSRRAFGARVLLTCEAAGKGDKACYAVLYGGSFIVGPHALKKFAEAKVTVPPAAQALLDDKVRGILCSCAAPAVPA